jgi:hypothetical protein
MINKIINFCKKNNACRNLYHFYLKNKDNIKKKHNLKGHFVFENRSNKSEKLCIILSGYKSNLYNDIFERIESYIPSDIDVCIASSGKYDILLSNIAKRNNWSYISTKRNSVTLIQNICINSFPNAKFIYKLDEDIFITKGFFENLMKTYLDCSNSGLYNVGFVAPLIPINGYGYYQILKKYNLLDYYQNNFEKPIIAAGADRQVETNPNVAKFFWGEKNILPNIDSINNKFQSDAFYYEACPIRFSIGAILFSRDIWHKMSYFKVDLTPCMGYDEEQLCSYCMINSKAIIVSYNSVVGHFSFGSQYSKMLDFYKSNPNNFKCHDKEKL